MKSFTLIEILIVISMILILTILVVPNFHLASSKMALERSAYMLAQDLRDAEEMALSSRGAFGTSYFPRGGYGLFFDKVDSYIIFADCDGDKGYDETGGSDCQSGSYPEKVEQVFLETGVEIKFSATYKLDKIVFYPPDPIITMQPPSNPTPGVTLISTRDNSELIVSINEVGRIEIIPGP